jgi:hypothetical protein
MKSTRVERQLITGGFSRGFTRGLREGFDPRTRCRCAGARDAWAGFRERAGYARSARDILTDGASQHKLAKNETRTVGLMLTPERGIMRPELEQLRAAAGLDGAWNLCPWASRGCAGACLSHSGQSGMPDQQYAQAVRTVFMLSHPEEFGYLIGWQLGTLARGGPVAVRLNTTSDIRFELVSPDGMALGREYGVTFYDYTKAPESVRPEGAGYDLTRSASERDSLDDIRALVESGERVAVPVFARPEDVLPDAWHGLPVIDGDLSDYRPSDPKGHVLLLRVKGHLGARDTSGFIRQLS